jgi:hypothetical protein
MIDCLAVTVAKDKWASGTDKKRCRWLGHSSYKCAACKLGYIRVKSETDFPEKCECGAFVFVERERS